MTTTTTPATTTTECRNEYCVSDDDYVDMIEAYVFPTTFEWILISLYAVVFFLGLVGNALVCFAVWRNRHMRTVTNYFIVNLSLADILVIVICLPPTVVGDVTETWYLGGVMCKIVQYLQVSRVRVRERVFVFGRVCLSYRGRGGVVVKTSPIASSVISVAECFFQVC